MPNWSGSITQPIPPTGHPREKPSLNAKRVHGLHNAERQPDADFVNKINDEHKAKGSQSVVYNQNLIKESTDNTIYDGLAMIDLFKFFLVLRISLHNRTSTNSQKPHRPSLLPIKKSCQYADFTFKVKRQPLQNQSVYILLTFLVSGNSTASTD